MISGSSELPQQKLGRGLLGANFAVALIPIVVNGALSHFQPRHSTFAQRVWTMTWLAFGIISDNVGNVGVQYLIPYSVPAIGGFVVVSKMIMQYGNCSELR